MKTFELIAETGLEQTDLDPLFAALDADMPGAINAVHDAANLCLEKEHKHRLWGI